MAVIGSIIGDIIGSQYEFQLPDEFNPKNAELFSDKCKFTDDTVMTLATKYAILNNKTFTEAYQLFGRKYEDVGYGGFFRVWILEDNPEPYGSFGNGSAMRVSYIGEHFESVIDVIEYAKKSAECTHNHDEGIKGAITTAKCIWMAKTGHTKGDIYNYAISQYPASDYMYSPQYSIDSIKDNYKWNDICQDSVPVAIRCVLEANSYIEFIRNVFKLKCDMDTICAIGGGIAEELFGGTGLDNNNILKGYLTNELYQLCINKKINNQRGIYDE